MSDEPGFEMAMIAVAVVLPFKSNHNSEYFGPITWNHGWAIPAIICPVKISAYDEPGDKDFGVPAYRIHEPTAMAKAATMHYTWLAMLALSTHQSGLI